MFEIGTSLRQARQHRALEISDVERETRIRARYLSALEDERFEVLPGVAYVRGFLRTYAEFLGLDGNLVIDEFNVRFAPPEDEQQSLQPASLSRPGSRLGRPVVGVAAAGFTFAVLAVWQLGFTSAERTPIPQARAATPVLHHVPKTVPAARRAAKRQPKHALPAAVLVVRAARGDCWVAVRLGSARGPLLYQRTVGRGGVVRFGLRKALWVRLGAPWNTDVTVRGRRLPAFGRRIVNLRAA